jgi:hypothetical protein
MKLTSQPTGSTAQMEETLRNMSAEEKAKVFLRASMRIKIIDSLNEMPCKQENLDWIRTLCEELKTRIAKLTPNRQELVDVWNRDFDVDLFMQMLQHAAVDSKDANQIVEIAFARISMLCAPAQDEAVQHAKETILTQQNVSEKLALLLEISDAILTDIETMVKNFAS